jgi:flagellar hook protein FlgE
VSGAVTAVTLTNPGTGYNAGEILTIVGGAGSSGATIAISSLRAGVKTLGSVTSGSGYTDGIYEDVPLTGSTGTGARATIVVSAGRIVKTTLTESGSGYLNGATLSVAANSIGGTGTGFSVPISAVNTAIAGGEGTRGATYNLRLKDGTNLSVTQVSEAGNGTAKYTVNVDRYAVFATLDGNAVGQNASDTGLSTVKIGGILTNEQTSLGTVAFVGGKNIDSLSRDAFGTPQFDTQFKIDASGGTGSGWGQTNNGGVVQFTLKSTDMTAYSSAGQTYANSQDGSATSQLASYNVDSSGRLTAQYDNGSSVVKGQLILAYFNNLEGLIPNGNNTYEASQSSGEPLLSFPGDGTLGAIRSKAVEQSNVDLTEELVKLMVLQRQYSAVSQATKVMAATLIDDAINIGR